MSLTLHLNSLENCGTQETAFTAVVTCLSPKVLHPICAELCYKY